MNHVKDQGNPSFEVSGQRIISEGRSSIAYVFPNKPLGQIDEIQ